MTLDDIYDEICSYEGLYQSHLEARKGKRYRDDVLVFTDRLEENLIELQNELIWQTYKVGKYRQFYVREPKLRLVMALQYRDRIVQWAIYRQLYPTKCLLRIPTPAGGGKAPIRRRTNFNTGCDRSAGNPENGIT